MRDDINHVFAYAEALSGPVPDYLHRIERETFLKTLAPQMLCGRLQGRMLALLSKLLRPKRILEIGTFTGYSALCLAEGLTSDGVLDTVEGNPEIAFWAERNFRSSPYAGQIRLHRTDALALTASLTEPYDLVFLDGDKGNYPRYFERLLPFLNAGGLFISDNVLWDGRVIDVEDHDKDVRALAAYNQQLAEDDRIELLVLPLRDGLSIARKL